MDILFERYLSPSWADHATDKPLWEHIYDIPDEELWSAHQRNKERLIVFARDRLQAQMQRRGTYHTEINRAEEVLDPEALTIGFARRFVTYKRGDLLMKDPQRLIKFLNDPKRPVQIIFAGKAHPRDTSGKDIIRNIVHFASQDQVRRRIVFLEDYDIDIARILVRGVDVWLNNPRRPMEASGTSGMKAAMNGVLNLSTLDGWWCEGYTPDGGWAIGSGEVYDDVEYQDLAESQALYNIIESEIVPLFYTRAADNLPRAWIRRVKNSIKYIAPRFNTHRMVAEYTRRFYNLAATRWDYLTADTMAKAKALSKWKSDIRQAWPEFSINDVILESKNGQADAELNPRQPQLKVGAQLKIRALVSLGKVNPNDIAVELYHGPVDSWGNIKEGSPVRMSYEKAAEQGGEHWFSGSVRCADTGQHGVAVRLLPNNPDLVTPHELGLILWESTKNN
jgi:starch phosphorylase